MSYINRDLWNEIYASVNTEIGYNIMNIASVLSLIIKNSLTIGMTPKKAYKSACEMFKSDSQHNPLIFNCAVGVASLTIKDGHDLLNYHVETEEGNYPGAQNMARMLKQEINEHLSRGEDLNSAYKQSINKLLTKDNAVVISQAVNILALEEEYTKLLLYLLKYEVLGGGDV